jgi:hypothetical protein
MFVTVIVVPGLNTASEEFHRPKTLNSACDQDSFKPRKLVGSPRANTCVEVNNITTSSAFMLAEATNLRLPRLEMF